MNISIVIPCFNEEFRIAKTLEAVLAFIKNNENLVLDVIVVDDGSTDRTKDVVAKYKEIQYVGYEVNRGKGYAVRKGLKVACGDLVYICDADLSTPIIELLKFIDETDDYDCIIGSRAHNKSVERSSLLRKLGGKIGNLCVRLLLNVSIYDTQCGFKLLNRKSIDYFLKTTKDRWAADFESLYLMERANLSIKELPVVWQAVDGSKVGFSSYPSTLKELILIWWQYEGFSTNFFMGVWQQFGDFIRYIIVGVITNLLNILLFAFLVSVYEPSFYVFGGVKIQSYQIFETIDYFVTIVFLNFSLHKFWTFQQSEWRHGEFQRYVVLLVVNYVLGLGILTFSQEVIGTSVLLGKLIALSFIVSWNFLILKKLIYKTGN